ncbi:MAG: LysR family transcriptional regulator [Candidatus Kapaibacterium sp.]
MNYTLHQLRIFHTISRTKSITKAAEELHLTQPAVSIQLRQFQEQFDVPLVEIVGRKLYVTDFGEEIARAAERILDEVYAIDFRTQSYKGRLSGRLRFSIVSTAQYFVPTLLSEFYRSHEGIEWQLDVTNKARVVESLERNEVDFAIMSILPESLKVETLELMENKLFVVSHTPVASRRKHADLADLQDMPLIYRETGSGTRTLMERFAAQHDLPTRKKLELSSYEAVKQAVIAGLGASIIPLVGIRRELESKALHIIKVKGFPITSTWRLVWLASKRLSPAAAACLETMTNDRQRIVRRHFAWMNRYE